MFRFSIRDVLWLWLAACCPSIVAVGCQSATLPPAVPQAEQTASTEIADQASTANAGARPTTAEDLARIERELQIKLPVAYREFMLTRSKELLGYTYPLRGETELWFDSEFFGFNVDRLLSENEGQRSPGMAAGDAFPGWWKEYFFFGTNGGGDYYAMRLDGTPGVWFISCDSGEIRPYAESLDEYVAKSLEDYERELTTYGRLEELYQRKVRGDVNEADFEEQWQAIIAGERP
jgi:hypothetical protein